MSGKLLVIVEEAKCPLYARDIDGRRSSYLEESHGLLEELFTKRFMWLSYEDVKSASLGLTGSKDPARWDGG